MTHAEFLSGIAPFWDPDHEHSFCTLHQQLTACEKKVQKEYAIALEGSLDLVQKWAFFREVVKKVEEIEKALSKAYTIASEAYIPSLKNPTFKGDYEIFSKRLDCLTSDISKIYEKSLYPFLQMLRNVEKGWNPSNVVCTVWDTWNRWMIKNPKKEVIEAFPLPSSY